MNFDNEHKTDKTHKTEHKTDCHEIKEKSLRSESIYEAIRTRPSLQSYSASHGRSIQVDKLYSKASESNLLLINQESQNFLNRHTYSAEEKIIHNFLSDLEAKTTTESSNSYGLCFKCNRIVFGRDSGCTAMNHIYHVTCFICHKCQANLQGKPFYTMDGEAYCEDDYWETLEKCSVCKKPILERILRATGKPYHPNCFSCVVCKKSLDGIPFTVDAVNQIYCIEDFHRKFAPRCCVCKEPITQTGDGEAVRVVALDRSFHFECYKCEDCNLLLSSEVDGLACYPLDNHVLCKECNAKRVQILTCKMQNK